MRIGSGAAARYICASNRDSAHVDRCISRIFSRPLSRSVAAAVSDRLPQLGARARSFVMLVYPTVVIELQVAYGRSYSQLIALSTASFIAFGLFSLPAGWLADHWSRRNMMVAFYVGCGLSLVGAALAPTLMMLGWPFSRSAYSPPSIIQSAPRW